MGISSLGACSTSGSPSATEAADLAGPTTHDLGTPILGLQDCNQAACSESCALTPGVSGGTCGSILGPCTCNAVQWPASPTWLGWDSLSGSVTSNPVAVTANTNDYNPIGVYATVAGEVFERWNNIFQWNPLDNAWANLGNDGNPFYGVAAVTIGARVELFAVDAFTGHLMHQEGITPGIDEPTWNSGGWEDLGGSLLAITPTVIVSQPGNQINVFGVSSTGTAPSVTYIRGTGYGAFGAWSSAFATNSATQSAPAAVSWGPNRIDLFLRGTDNQLYHEVSGDNGATWLSSWEPLGGSVGATPAVASWAPNRLDVVVSEFGTANLSSISYNGKAWSSWIPMNGTAWLDTNGPAAPTVITTAPWNLQVFVQGSSRAFYDSSLVGADANGFPKWGPWQTVTSCIAQGGSASVVSRDGTSLDVFVTGAPDANGHTSVWHDTTSTSYMPGPGTTPPPACPTGALGEPCGSGLTCTANDTECLADSTGLFTCTGVGNLQDICRQSPPCAPQNGIACSTTPPPTCDTGFRCLPNASNVDTCQQCGGEGLLPCTTGEACLPPFVPTNVGTASEVTCQPPCGKQQGGACCSNFLPFRGENVAYPTCGGDLTCNAYGDTGALTTGTCVTCGHMGEFCCNAWTSMSSGTCTQAGTQCDQDSQKCVDSSGNGGSSTCGVVPYATCADCGDTEPADATFSVSITAGNRGCSSLSVSAYVMAGGPDGIVSQSNTFSFTLGASPSLETIQATFFDLPSASYSLTLVIDGLGNYTVPGGMCVGDDAPCSPANP